MIETGNMSEDCLLQSLDDFSELLPVESQSSSAKGMFTEEGEIVTSSDDADVLDHALETIGDPLESKNTVSKTQISPDKLNKTTSSKEDLSVQSNKKVKKEKKKAKKELKKLKKKRKVLLSSVDEFSEESDYEFGFAARKKETSGEKVAKKRKFSFEDLNPEDAGTYRGRTSFEMDDLLLDQYSDDDSEEEDLRIRLENKRRRRLNLHGMGTFDEPGTLRQAFNFRRGRLKSSEGDIFLKDCKELRKNIKDKLKKSSKTGKKNDKKEENQTKRSKSSSKTNKVSAKKDSKRKRRASTDVVCISSDSEDHMVLERAESEKVNLIVSPIEASSLPFDKLLQQSVNKDVLDKASQLYRKSETYELSQSSYQCDSDSSTAQNPGHSKSSDFFEPSTNAGADSSQSILVQDPGSSQDVSDQNRSTSNVSPPNFRRLSFPKPNSVTAPHLGYIVENGWANLDELMNQFVDNQLKILQQSLKEEPEDNSTSEPVLKTENIEESTAPASSCIVSVKNEELKSNDKNTPVPTNMERGLENASGTHWELSETRVPNNPIENLIKQEPREGLIPGTVFDDRNLNVCGKQGFQTGSRENLHQGKFLNQSDGASNDKSEDFDIDHELDVRLDRANGTENERSSKSPVRSSDLSDMSRSSTPESFSSSFHSYDSSGEIHDASFAARSNQESKNVAQKLDPAMPLSLGAVEITLDKPDYISCNVGESLLQNNTDEPHFVSHSAENAMPTVCQETLERDTETNVRKIQVPKPIKILERDTGTNVRKIQVPKPIKILVPRHRSSDIEKSNADHLSRRKATAGAKTRSKPSGNDECLRKPTTELSASDSLQIPENIRSLFAGTNSGSLGPGESSSVDILSNLSSRIISGEVKDKESKCKDATGTYELISKNTKVKKSASEQISISGKPDPRLLPGNRKKCASKFQSNFVKLKYWCKQVVMERSRGYLNSLEPIELLPGDQMPVTNNTSRDHRLCAPLLKEMARSSDSMIPDDPVNQKRNQQTNHKAVALNGSESSHKTSDRGNGSRSRKDVRPIPLERSDGFSFANDPRRECSQYPIVNRPCTLLTRVKFSVDKSLKTHENNHLTNFSERNCQQKNDNAINDSLPIINNGNRINPNRFDSSQFIENDRLNNFGGQESRSDLSSVFANPTPQVNEIHLSSSNSIPSVPMDPRLRSNRLSLTSPPKLVPVPPPRAQENFTRVDEEDLKAITDFDYRSVTPRVDQIKYVASKTICNAEFRGTPGNRSTDNFTDPSLPLNLDARLDSTNINSGNLRENLMIDSTLNAISGQLHEFSKDWRRLGYEKKMKQSKNQNVRNVSSTSAPGNLTTPQSSTTPQLSQQNVRSLSSFSNANTSLRKEDNSPNTAPPEYPGDAVSSKTSEVPQESNDCNPTPEVEKPVVAPRRKKNPLMPEFE